MPKSDKTPGGSTRKSTSRPFSGRDFEAFVAEFYRALGDKVETNIRLDGQEIDILVSRYLEGVGPVTFLVECKDWSKPVGNQEAQKFVQTVSSLRAIGKIQYGIMASRNGFTPDAKSVVASIPYANLITPAELEQVIFDPTFGTRRLVVDYRTQTIFDAFVEIDGRRTAWQDLATNDSRTEIIDVCAEIFTSIVEGRRNNFFLLADYGSGKSTLLRRLQYQLCESKLDKISTRLPVFVPLKDFHNTQDISILLRNSLKNDFLRDISTEFLWKGIELGHFTFLLDGFDEMTDRSGEQKRQELFQKLLGLLNSPCPVVLTSRPGFFVAKGEVENLVSRWQNASRPLRILPPPPSKKAVERYKTVEELKANLLQGLRATTPRSGYDSMPDEDSLSVINLQPFNRDKISQYIGRRLQAASTVSGGIPYDLSLVLAFIDRVYDLSDLASKPLLLRLIVDTILLGGIDISDPDLQFGPSGLYETYTTLKLEMDWEKGSVRQGALTREQRRQLAEMVAVSMYNTSTLDARLGDVLESLPSEATSSDGVLLSAEEITTDFFTCSFLSIDERQVCTFAHKSFMEFFLARTIKNRLAASNPTLQSKLPWAVLYFLGGFAPTEKNVAERLWKMFLDTPTEHGILRRNLLVAYLFTRPDHTSRKIRDVDLTDADYSDLSLSGITIRKSRIGNISVRRLKLVKPNWTDVILHKCSFDEWLIVNGSMSVEVDACEASTITLSGESRLTADALKSSMQRVNAVDSEMNVSLRDCTIGLLEAERSEILIEAERSRISEVQISNSDINLDTGNPNLEGLLVSRGTIRQSTVRIAGNWPSGSVSLQSCFLTYVTRGDDKSAIHIRDMPPQLTSDSCVVGIGFSVDEQKLTGRRFGVVGLEYRGTGLEYRGTFDGPDMFHGWGILVVTGESAATVLPGNQEYSRISRSLLFCARTWFTREFTTEGKLGSLAAIINRNAEVRPSMDRLVASDLMECRARVEDIIRTHS